MSTRRYVTVWDPLVRIFHWSVATLFLLNYWLLEPGETLHEWAGYAIAGLLVIRIVWGWAGSHNARFASFWPTPTRLRRHVQQLRKREFDPTEGHNPLGALMIFFLLSLLALTAVSGWMQGLDRFWGEDWVEQLHEYTATTLMVAVVLHVGAVILMSRFSGLSLIRTMISGRRPLLPPSGTSPIPADKTSR
ncbi:MAG: cytochrome b/b6 domain-containing protein [Spongiibacteraceae bacterium]